MKVIVLGGGDSPEREISLRSAKYIAKAARDAGFDVEEYDPSKGLTYIVKVPKSTLVLPILHGINGEDGVIQAVLEEHNLPYLGSNSTSSAACFDKWKTREVLKATNLPMTKGALVTKNTYASHFLSKRPHVLKVRRGGSSIGTLIVRDIAKRDMGEIDKIFTIDSEALIEELIEGPELTIPILDQSALPVIEIVPPEGKEFDYENKYNGLTQEICPPINVSMDIQKEAQVLAEKVHKVMNCRHLSRVDIMADKNDSLFVLEINTIPGLTDQSLYPKSAAAAGIDMPSLVKKFVDMVARDYDLKSSLLE